jgi:hypothetical protein
MPPSLLRSFAALFLLLAAAPAARADEAETEGARLYREGRALLLAERFDEACPKLAESQRLEPRGGTLLNLAACHERQGKVASAWSEFHDALAAARAESQPKRARLAEERIAALGPRVPWLTINVTAEAAAQGAHVTFDGGELPRLGWGKDMPVDPGDHALVISAAGRVEETRTVSLREGERQTVDIASLGEAAHPADPALPLPAPSKEPAPTPKEPGKSRWVFDLGLMLGYMSADLNVGYPNLDESLITVRSGSGARSCAELICGYAIQHHGGTVGLLSLYAGYAPKDWFHFGGRMILGPRFQGGALFATGPSVSFRVAGPLWLGASMLMGYASQYDAQGRVQADDVITGTTTAPMTGTTDFAFGAGAEIRWDLWHGPRGTLSVTSQPFFIGDRNGAAVVLPIGAAYRFQ